MEILYRVGPGVLFLLCLLLSCCLVFKGCVELLARMDALNTWTVVLVLLVSICVGIGCLYIIVTLRKG